MKWNIALLGGFGAAALFCGCGEDTNDAVRDAVNESAPVKYVDTVLEQAKPTQKTSVQCMNNLKQIGTGLLMFAMDNNDMFPAELSELTGIPALQCPADQTNYLFPGSGINSLTADSSAPVVTCPVHGHKLYSSGSVEKGKN